jgi:hypothetical protein
MNLVGSNTKHKEHEMLKHPYIIRQVSPVLHWDLDYQVGTVHTPIDYAFTIGGALVKKLAYDRLMPDDGHEACPWLEIVDRNGQRVYPLMPSVARRLAEEKANELANPVPF